MYGENACYEWQMEDEHPVLFRMSPVVPGEKRTQTVARPEPPDRADLLPPSIGRYTKRFVYGEDERHLSFEQGGGHHGRTRTWFMSSSAASSSGGSRGSMPSLRPTGRPPASARTSRRWPAVAKCSFRSSIDGDGREANWLELHFQRGRARVAAPVDWRSDPASRHRTDEGLDLVVGVPRHVRAGFHPSTVCLARARQSGVARR